VSLFLWTLGALLCGGVAHAGDKPDPEARKAARAEQKLTRQLGFDTTGPEVRDEGSRLLTVMIEAEGASPADAAAVATELAARWQAAWAAVGSVTTVVPADQAAAFAAPGAGVAADGMPVVALTDGHLTRPTPVAALHQALPEPKKAGTWVVWMRFADCGGAVCIQGASSGTGDGRGVGAPGFVALRYAGVEASRKKLAVADVSGVYKDWVWTGDHGVEADRPLVAAGDGTWAEQALAVGTDAITRAASVWKGRVKAPKKGKGG
jgi:hypothetical protein